MPAKTKAASPKDQSSATIGFEAKLWLAADKLRNNMDAAEYKHVVCGIETDFGDEHADTFRSVQHPDLRAAFVIATALRDSASEPSSLTPLMERGPLLPFSRNNP